MAKRIYQIGDPIYLKLNNLDVIGILNSIENRTFTVLFPWRDFQPRILTDPSIVAAGPFLDDQYIESFYTELDYTETLRKFSGIRRRENESIEIYE